MSEAALDLSSLDSDEKQKFFAFTLFDLHEAVSDVDLAVLWQISENEALQLCRDFEKKSLLKHVDGSVDEKFSVFNEAVYNDAVEQAKTATSFVKFCLNVDGVVVDDLLAESSVQIVVKCVQNQRRSLLERIVKRINAKALAFICCQTTHGKSLLHYLYNSAWTDDGRSYNGKKHSYRIIVDVVKKLRLHRINDVDVLKVIDGNANSLLEQLFDEETAYQGSVFAALEAFPRRDNSHSEADHLIEGANDRERLHCLLVKPAGHDYEEIKWRKGELKKDFDEDPLIKAVIMGSPSELEQAVSKNSSKLHVAIKYAARLGKTENLKVLLDHDCKTTTVNLNVRKVDANGRTALAMAAANGHLATVTLLHETCSSAVELVDTKGQTALFLASANGHLDVVKYLHEKFPAAVSQQDSDEQTPLAAAAEKGHLEVVEFLYQLHPKAVEIATKYEQLPITLAAFYGYLDVVKFLHEKYPAGAEKANGLNENAISAVVLGGHLEIAKFLCPKHPDALKKKYQLQEQSLLGTAASSGVLEMVKFVHNEYPAAIDILDRGNEPPLLSAVESGDVDVVKFIYELRPEAMKATNNFGRVSLLIACDRGYLDVAKYLYQLDPSAIKLTDTDGRTALSLAVGDGNLALVKFVQELYPEAVELPDKNKRLPVLWAAHFGGLEVFKFLHQIYPAGIDTKDAEGESASSLAKKSGNKELVQLLKELKPSKTQRVLNFFAKK